MSRIRSITAAGALFVLILVLSAPVLACLMPMQGHACCKSHDGFQQQKAPLSRYCCSVSEQHPAVASTPAAPIVAKVLVAIVTPEAPTLAIADHRVAADATSPPIAPLALSSQLRI